jgi:hypothetical protein
VAAAFAAGDAVHFWRGVRALPPLAAQQVANAVRPA